VQHITWFERSNGPFSNTEDRSMYGRNGWDALITSLDELRQFVSDRSASQVIAGGHRLGVITPPWEECRDRMSQLLIPFPDDYLISRRVANAREYAGQGELNAATYELRMARNLALTLKDLYV
jgi:hypothetical protein